ncbi:hypothetical protein ACFWPQ_01820 [Streptomyces sp. NPDC058464]|uniref:hypothetical protein n=1 Tax=Streptomyces sp. NPDC058464 TaxID=3346511 RepID=UPI00365DB754
MSLRRETQHDDNRRTGALLDAVDRAFDNDAGAAALEDERSFESVLLFGIAGDPAQPYPPGGHTYPKRG